MNPVEYDTTLLADLKEGRPTWKQAWAAMLFDFVDFSLKCGVVFFAFYIFITSLALQVEEELPQWCQMYNETAL